MLLTLSSNVYHSLENTIFFMVYLIERVIYLIYRRWIGISRSPDLPGRLYMLPLVHHPLQMCMEVVAHLQFHALFLLDPQYVKQNRLDPQNRLKRYILLYILRTLGIFYCLLQTKLKGKKTLRMSHPTSHYGRC